MAGYKLAKLKKGRANIKPSWPDRNLLHGFTVKFKVQKGHAIVLLYFEELVLQQLKTS